MTPIRYFIIIFCVLIASFSEGAEVITHSKTPYQTMSQSKLRSVFAMRLQEWPDGSAIVVYVLRDRYPLHLSFCKNILGIFPYQLRRNWDRMVFSGTGQAPIVVKTEQEMKTMVSTTPGSIGYISKELIDETVHLIQIEK